MSPSTCNNCKKEVSALAETCPHCGEPSPTESEGSKLFKAVLNLGGLLALGYTAFVVFSCLGSV